MTDLYFFILTAINLFVLAYMCVLVNLSETLNPKQAKGFLLTFVLIGGISILEILSVLVDDGSIWLRPINIISKLSRIWSDSGSIALLGLCDGQFRTYKTVAQSCNVHRNRILFDFDGIFVFRRISIFRGFCKSLFQRKWILYLYADALRGNRVFVFEYAGNGPKFSEPWKGADLWTCWISCSGNNGTDFDSIGSYYMALRNADRSSPFSVLQ